MLSWSFGVASQARGEFSSSIFFFFLFSFSFHFCSSLLLAAWIFLSFIRSILQVLTVCLMFNVNKIIVWYKHLVRSQQFCLQSASYHFFFHSLWLISLFACILFVATKLCLHTYTKYSFIYSHFYLDAVVDICSSSLFLSLPVCLLLFCFILTRSIVYFCLVFIFISFFRCLFFFIYFSSFESEKVNGLDFWGVVRARCQ